MSDDLLMATAQAAVMKGLMSGAKTGTIPAYLFNNASKQAQDGVRSAFEMAGIRLVLDSDDASNDAGKRWWEFWK